MATVPAVGGVTSATDSHRGLRGFACEPCVKRKIKCDRLEPCGNCRKRRNVICVYNAADPRRISAQKSDPTPAGGQQDPDANIPFFQRRTDGSFQYEAAAMLGVMNAAGQDDTHYGEDDNASGTASDQEDAPRGDERSPLSPMATIAGWYPSKHRLMEHPDAETIDKLFQLHIEGVHPVLLLAPTWQQQKIIERAKKTLASTENQLSAEDEAYLFSMYGLSVLSMQPDECRQILGRSQKTMMLKYRRAAEMSFNKAHILKTNKLELIQAFTMYIQLLAKCVDAQTLYSMTGLLARLGERLMLHRDGSKLGLSPFETQLRRRIWWSICKQDERAAQLVGCHYNRCSYIEWETEKPSNIADADLKPDMTWDTKEDTRSFSAMFAMLRYELMSFHRLLPRSPSGVATLFSITDEMNMEKKLEIVDEFAAILQSKFYQYIDPVNPIHFAASLGGHGALAQARLIVYYQYATREPSKGRDTSELLQQVILQAIKALSYCNLRSSDTLKPLRWQCDSYFLWQALVVLLKELSEPNAPYDTPTRSKAWSMVEETFNTWSDMLMEKKGKLYVNIRDLALRAWQNEQALPKPTMRTIPVIIEKLLQNKMKREWDSNGATGDKERPEKKQRALADTQDEEASLGSVPTPAPTTTTGDTNSTFSPDNTADLALQFNDDAFSSVFGQTLDPFGFDFEHLYQSMQVHDDMAWQFSMPPPQKG